MKIGCRVTIGSILLLSAAAAAAQPADGKSVANPRDVIALEKGVWDAVITLPPRAPGGKPTTAIGVQVNELRSGGMWMLNRISVNGGAYEGTGIWGYDQKTGRYSGAWIDNGNAHIRMDDGMWDPGTSTMTWTAAVELPDGRTQRTRATSTFVGDTRTYRSFVVTPAGDVLTSTVIFTRRSNSPQR